MGQGGEQGEAGYRTLKSPLYTGNQTAALASQSLQDTRFGPGGKQGPLSRLTAWPAGWAPQDAQGECVASTTVTTTLL